MERSAPQVRGVALVGVAMTFGNLCAYAFVVAAARILSPASYGEVGAVMGLLLVLGVLSLGLQAGAARTVVTSTDTEGAIQARTIRAGVRAAAILLVGVVLSAPLLSRVLDLSAIVIAVFAGFAAAELALMGAVAGLLQGARDWNGFAAVQLFNGIGRLVVAGAVLLVWPTASGAILGVALGNLLPMLTALAQLRRRRRRAAARVRTASTVEATGDLPGLGVLAVLRDSHLLLAMLVLTNIDVLLARVTLDDHTSGLYAAGLIITKAVVFLPQFVITVAFPDMVERGERRALRITVAVVAGLGALTVVGVAILAPVAVSFVGGAEYSAVENRLWLFAVLGTLLALVNVFVFRALATSAAHREWWVWGAVVVVLAASLAVERLTGLLLLVIAVDAVLLGVLTWWERRDDRAQKHSVSAPPRATTPRDPH